MQKSVLIFSLLFFASLAIGQKNSINIVSGTLIGFDGEGLAYAPVGITGKNKGVTTDSTGNFKIALEYGDKLHFSYLGYQSVEYYPEEITEELHGIIALDNAMLREVVIVGNRMTWIPVPPIICVFDQDAHLGINAEATPVSYYPNPTTGIVHVVADLPKGIINVFSSDGKLMLRQGVNDIQTELSLAGLGAGMYFLSYENEHWAQAIGKVSLLGN